MLKLLTMNDGEKNKKYKSGADHNPKYNPDLERSEYHKRLIDFNSMSTHQGLFYA